MNSLLPASLALLATLSFAPAAHAESSWKVESHPAIGLVQYVTHGTHINGHEFSFIKMPGQCDRDVLWLIWSTMQATPDALRGKSAVAKVVVTGPSQPDTVLFLNIPMGKTAYPFTKTMTVFTFTNYEASSEFMSALATGTAIHITLTGADKLLDVREDDFKLNGYAASRLEAQKECEKLSKSANKQKAAPSAPSSDGLSLSDILQTSNAERQ